MKRMSFTIMDYDSERGIIVVGQVICIYRDYVRFVTETELPTSYRTLFDLYRARREEERYPGIDKEQSYRVYGTVYYGDLYWNISDSNYVPKKNFRYFQNLLLLCFFLTLDLCGSVFPCFVSVGLLLPYSPSLNTKVLLFTHPLVRDSPTFSSIVLPMSL